MLEKKGKVHQNIYSRFNVLSSLKKVRIVAVSVDEDREGVLKRIEERKWFKIIHFKLNGWDKDNKLIKHFAIRGNPFVCLVDKNGVINYVGHPSTISLEERINSLLAPTNESKPDEASSWDQGNLVKIFKILVKWMIKYKCIILFAANSVTVQGSKETFRKDAPEVYGKVESKSGIYVFTLSSFKKNLLFNLTPSRNHTNLSVTTRQWSRLDSTPITSWRRIFWNHLPKDYPQRRDLKRWVVCSKEW